MNESAATITLTIQPEHSGLRLDRVLAGELAGISRTRLQELIKHGQVTLGGGTITDPGRRVKPGEEITVDVPPPVAAEPAPEHIALKVVFEDRHLIVIDKPAGLVVHPAPGNRDGTLVNALIAHCGASLSGIGGVMRPGIVHRLDKNTSGLLVVAKTDAAHQGLAAQFADHGQEGPLERAYIALVWGTPPQPAGTVSTQIGRHPTNRQKMAVLRTGGRHAVTHYRALDTSGTGPQQLGMVKCTLETGRTHQIRVHLAYLGCPVIGDPVYSTGFRSKNCVLPEELGSAIIALNRQALHAATLGFEHPVTGKSLRFSSDLPGDMARIVEISKMRLRKS
jgi:23S rRNA pseudouridine1911/1915/1917 synthase